MENNQEKEYWGKSFYGSKLNTVLLLVLIILMVFALRIMLKEKETYLPIFEQDNLNNNTSVLPENDESTLVPVVAEKTEQSIGAESDIEWVKTKKFALYIPVGADYSESYYLSPGAQAQGMSEEKAGAPQMSFSLNGFVVFWGGPQSSCRPQEFGVFKYGVSITDCVKYMRSDISPGSPGYELTVEDKKIFGDFVLKNQ